MSDQVYWFLEVSILPGQLDNFRAVVRELIASSEKEPDTLAYEWNLSADNTFCHVYERYRNSAAVVIHGASFGRYAARFLQTCRINRFDVYGSPSAEVKADLAGLNPTYYNFLGGFSR